PRLTCSQPPPRRHHPPRAVAGTRFQTRVPPADPVFSWMTISAGRLSREKRMIRSQDAPRGYRLPSRHVFLESSGTNTFQGCNSAARPSAYFQRMDNEIFSAGAHDSDFSTNLARATVARLAVDFIITETDGWFRVRGRRLRP